MLYNTDQQNELAAMNRFISLSGWCVGVLRRRRAPADPQASLVSVLCVSVPRVSCGKWSL